MEAAANSNTGFNTLAANPQLVLRPQNGVSTMFILRPSHPLQPVKLQMLSAISLPMANAKQ